MPSGKPSGKQIVGQSHPACQPFTLWRRKSRQRPSAPPRWHRWRLTSRRPGAL